LGREQHRRHNSPVPSPQFADVKAVFFDLDDTLCGYWEAAARALQRVFSEFDLGHDAETMTGHWAVCFRRFCSTIKPSHWYAGYLKSGEPTRTELMRLVLLEAGIDDPALAKKIGDRYAEIRDEELKLFPESLAVIRALRGTYPLGLITNGPADIQRQEVQTLGLEPLFDHILIEGEMGEGKPLLSVFRRAESLVGLQPGEMLFVGNSYGHDISPAIHAGWKTVWVRRASDVPPSAKGETNKPEPIPTDGRPLPDFIVDTLADLPALLRSATV
jgi:HAD superfamily hydrolase (TIGR01509 family)